MMSKTNLEIEKTDKPDKIQIGEQFVPIVKSKLEVYAAT